MRYVTLVAIETPRRRLPRMKRPWFIVASLLSLILLPAFPEEASAAPGVTPLTVSINSPSKREGNSGITIMTFKVTLSARPASTVTVHYQSFDGSAKSVAIGLDLADYVAVNGTLTFAPGDKSQTIAVQIIGDRRFEGSETFVVLLSNPTGGAILGDFQGIGTIVNDDH